jgi:hypothetical protein
MRRMRLVGVEVLGVVGIRRRMVRLRCRSGLTDYYPALGFVDVGWLEGILGCGVSDHSPGR